MITRIFARCIAIAIMFLGISTNALAFPTIEVSREVREIALTSGLSFLEDTSGELGLEDILRAENREKFQPVLGEIPSFGLSVSAFWVGFRVESTDSSPVKKYLELDFPILREVDLFVESEDGSFQRFSTGYGKAFSERPLLTRSFVFPLELKPSSPTRCFLRIQSLTALQAPLKLWDPGTYRNAENGMLTFYGVVYGGFLVFLLSNVVLVFWIRKRIYTYFFFGILTLLLYALSYRGLAGIYLWPDNLVLREMAIPTLIPVLTGFSLLSTVEFLRVDLMYPRIAQGMRWFSWATMVTVIPNWFWGNITRSTVLPLSSLLVCVFIIILTLLMFRRGRQWSSRVFCIAWAVVGVAATTFAFEKLGWIGRNALTEFGWVGSGFLWVLLLNLALALRLQELLNSKQVADKQASQLAAEAMLASEKRELEVKMITHSKLATLGELAGGMAHEITQPLSYIAGALELLLRRSKQGNLDFKRESYRLEVMHRQANRIGLIVNHLQTFGSGDFESSNNAVLVKELVENTLVLFRERFNQSGVSYNIKLHQENLRIRGNAHQLEQVLINLVQNAHQAITEQPSQNPRIEIEARQGVGGEMAWIAVKDNGSGIPHDVLDRVFDPFFTTKEVGKGTGLGLSIVYGIIQRHQGTIEYRAPGYKGGFGGMEIELPIYPEDAAAGSPDSDEELLPG